LKAPVLMTKLMNKENQDSSYICKSTLTKEGFETSIGPS
jgi:hypothetical protein